MIEESEDRLTEVQVQNILDILLEHFPHIAPAKNEDPAEKDSS